MALANILRTDAAVHRPLPADSELAQAISVPARAQQDAVWNQAQLNNQLRSHLKQYFPAALAAFQVRAIGLDSREARAVLAAAPDPATAARLTRTQLRSLLRKSGRQRNIDTWTDRLRTVFTSDYLHQLPLVEQAMGRQTTALVHQLDAACQAADDLAAAASEAFAQHPDNEIISSFPGIGSLTGRGSARGYGTETSIPTPQHKGLTKAALTDTHSNRKQRKPSITGHLITDSYHYWTPIATANRQRCVTARDDGGVRGWPGLAGRGCKDSPPSAMPWISTGSASTARSG